MDVLGSIKQINKLITKGMSNIYLNNPIRVLKVPFRFFDKLK